MAALTPHLLGPAATSRVSPRTISPEDWQRYESAMGEIFTAFGMDLDTPGTALTPDAIPEGAPRRDLRLRGRPEAPDRIPDRMPRATPAASSAR